MKIFNTAIGNKFLKVIYVAVLFTIAFSFSLYRSIKIFGTLNYPPTNWRGSDQLDYNNIAYTFYKYNHDEPIICRLIHGKVYSLRTLHWQCGCYFDPKDFYINHVYVVKDKKYVCAVKTDERIILSLLED